MPRPKRSKFKSGLPKRKPQSKPAEAAAPGDGQRLQKVMAAAGVGSRRDCEQLIVDGRVTIDGKVAKELGTRVDPQTQEIRLDGEIISVQRHQYFAVYKPVGLVCTNDDPAGRPRVIDLIPPMAERLFTVGRLDLSSEGLMLVTNDGELANRLAHPRYGVHKTYHVLVAGRPEIDELNKMKEGVHLAEGVVRVADVRIRQELKASTLLEIVLAEGKNREIRRLLARSGHKVMRLKRVSLGPLRLKDLEPGEIRRLNAEELRELREASKHETKRRRRPRRLKRGRKPPTPVGAAAAAERPAAKTDADLASRHPKMGGVARAKGPPRGKSGKDDRRGSGRGGKRAGPRR
jgi:23S rRNA pseudouridine2605 synthase